jgi:hypothetical protein
MNRRQRRGEEKETDTETPPRPIHDSPWFWVGVVMFLAASLTYVFSEDLSLRPRLPSAAPAAQTP